MRATAINHLIDNGFEAREICSVTGQKSEAKVKKTTNYLKILIWIMMKLTKPALNFTSKNHRLDSEDLRKGGLIIYEPNAYNPGYNGGEYFEL